MASLNSPHWFRHAEKLLKLRDVSILDFNSYPSRGVFVLQIGEQSDSDSDWIDDSSTGLPILRPRLSDLPSTLGGLLITNSNIIKGQMCTSDPEEWHFVEMWMQR